MSDRALYAQRRALVMSALGSDTVLIVSAAPEVVIGRDAELRYLLDAELYYLTGYREPEAVAVLAPGSETPFTLFVRPRDPQRELWTGVRGGVEAATLEFGADAAYPIGELPVRLPELLSKASRIYARADDVSPVSGVIRAAITNGRRTRARNGYGPHTIIDPGLLLDELRRSKDAHEIALIRQAAQITIASFQQTIAQVRPDMGEWQVEAMLEQGFRAAGADGWAFPTIVAGGPNATVLHYVSNSQPLRDGDLLLMDAGARFGMYCADITRTVPVNGRFSKAQRALYDVVLAAHSAAVRASRPGGTIDDVHRAAKGELALGVKDLGLVRAEDDAVENAVRRYYPHRTSHWLGLEVHDVGDYVTGGNAVRLADGMVYTIEPGLYVPADDTHAPEELRGVGVRIEDDVLITAAGGEILTAALPVTAVEIEKLMRGEQQ